MTENFQIDSVEGRDSWVAVLDLSAVGQLGLQALRLKQAVNNETLSVAQGPGWRVIFDGTLYNTAELETVLLPNEKIENNAQIAGLAYRRWGDKFLERIQGIFAILILDFSEGKFLAARDRLGFQPLFFVGDGDSLLFSDSILKLRYDPQLSISLNRPVLADYLSHRFPDEGETFFTEIRRLSPAGKLAVDLSSKARSDSKYWNPMPPGTPDDTMREEDLDQFEWLLEQAVRRAMKFGKTGLFLSGGLDSVSVGAVAADLSASEGWPLTTALSVAFPDPESNEEPVQRAVAAGLGFQQIVLPFVDGEGSEGLFWLNMQLNAKMGSPVNNPWRAVYRELTRRAKAYEVAVILTGGGGDDWLTVNPDYMADLLAQFDINNSIRFARSAVGSHKLPPSLIIKWLYWNSGIRPLLTRWMRRFGRVIAPQHLYDMRFKKFLREKPTPHWVAADPLLQKELNRRTEQSVRRLMDRPEPSGPYGFYIYSGISQTFDHFLISQSQEEDFEIGRQMGVRMLHPYWDSQLVEFLCKIPPRLLLTGGREKGLVRQSVDSRFPQLGFGTQKKVRASKFYMSLVARDGPVLWEKIGGAKALVELGIVKKSALEDVMNDSYHSDQILTAFRVWEVLNLESWIRAHK